MKNIIKKFMYVCVITGAVQLSYAGANFYINSVNSNDKVEIFATNNYGDSPDSYHHSSGGYIVDSTVEVTQSGNTTQIRLEEALNKNKQMTNDFNNRFDTNHEFVLNSKKSEPADLDADITLGISINGSSVKGTTLTNGNYIDGLTIAGEHGDSHNWAVASPTGSVYNDNNNKHHSNWGLDISTANGQKYCLKAIGTKNSVNLVDGECANAQNVDWTAIKASNIKFNVEQADQDE